MYQFFTEIFSTNSDKARLLSILISSIVAVGILLLNQYFVNKRERRNLRIEKIEEISKLISEYDRNAREFFYEFDDSSPNQAKLHGKAAIALQDIEMLLHLYFPNDVFVTHEEQFDTMLQLKNTLLERQDESGLAILFESHSVRDIHNKQVIDMHTACRNIIKKYT
ncbi:hypothetical protein [Vibrio splendidus]|uniref:hypothetical protein n=1 Tax=Vibrio splendidus TaxID=29497 RepID=UPI000C82D00B|nr:hypothetical protein [Vibrio splendidus]PMI54754.1 hypothetical protein BCU42_00145 [Vibrio splendidus]